MLERPDYCRPCPLYDLGRGFMKPSGTGKNLVVLVGESLGTHEVEAGLPFQGPAGNTLNKALARAGLNREDFYITNACHCQPPGNKLAGQWYTDDALAHCSKYLDDELLALKPRVIVGLGGIAARRLVPNLPVGILDACGYVWWNERYSCWVINTVHPSYIMRGKTAWTQVLIHNLQRAVEIAQHGFKYAETDYTLDCTPAEAMEWAEQFEAYHQEHPDLYLSCDIETPDKRHQDEEELDPEANEIVASTILRCGYSYREGHGMSIPWDGPFRVVHERLLRFNCQHLWWNLHFDVPHIVSQGIEIGGTNSDGMVAFHILNSDLRKSLGFVAPFFAKNYPMWKHTSSTDPARYNCMDADVAGINMRGTVELLKKHGLWDVYQKFVVELDPVYAAMTKAGMPVDRATRIESSKLLIRKRNEIREAIDRVVPDHIRPHSPKDGYKKPPKDTTGLTEIVFNGVLNKYCSNCSLLSPKKSHFKTKYLKHCSVCGEKWLKKHLKSCGGDPEPRQVNPCAGAEVVERMEGEKRWAKVSQFIPSTKGILAYQEAKGHPIIYTGRAADRKPTTNEKALSKLVGKYPQDDFYKLCLDDREVTKIGGSYVGWWNEETQQIESGFPVGPDGRVRGTFTHNPSTLRSSMVNPSLQVLPRGGDSVIHRLVKEMFVAPLGHIFIEADFKGIEARLVGWDAQSRDYYRLAGLDCHSYYTAYNLHRLKIISSADLPNLKWSDEDLMGALKAIKKRFPLERDMGKVCGHAGNYRVGPSHLSETFPQWFPRPKDAAIALGFYYELFPDIPRWHERICRQVDRTAIAKNAFGHVHRFYSVLAWERHGDKLDWSYGEDAKRLIAFGPQSNAALIGKAALKRLYYNYPTSMAQWLRLFIHDSNFLEVPVERADEAESILRFEMEKPIEEMPLDPAWGMGKYVTVGVDVKRGPTWASMA